MRNRYGLEIHDLNSYTSNDDTLGSILLTRIDILPQEFYMIGKLKIRKFNLKTLNY